MLKNMFSTTTVEYGEVRKTERGGGLFWSMSAHVKAMGKERLDQCDTNAIRQGETV